jgi:hypothetical protein
MQLAKVTTRAHTQDAPASCSKLLDAHRRRTRASTTRHPAAQALRQPRRAPRVLVSWPQRLYISSAVHRDYSSPGCTGSTSTSLCAMSTHLPAAAALRRLRRMPPRRRLLGVRLPRLVSTRKLVEDGSRDINN